MIEVNLLPEDRRPVERTPLPRFLAILVGVVGFCIEGVFLIWIVADFPQQEASLIEANRSIDVANKNLEQMRDYESSINEYKARITQVNRLYRDRRTWAPLLHRMSSDDVVPENIWYREINLKQGRPARGQRTAPQELFLLGYAAGGGGDGGTMFQATQDINDFVARLQTQIEDYDGVFDGKPKKDKAVEMTELSPPRGAPSNIPKKAATFGLKLTVKPKKPNNVGSAGATGNMN
jgi:Tfp pilus assembly protein PilN